MLREEQIIEKASKDSEIFYKVNDNYGDCYHGGFIDGAKWADEHPKQGLISIDKACEWLQENTVKDFDNKNLTMLFGSIIDMITDFRKAMEE